MTLDRLPQSSSLGEMPRWVNWGQRFFFFLFLFFKSQRPYLSATERFKWLSERNICRHLRVYFILSTQYGQTKFQAQEIMITVFFITEGENILQFYNSLTLKHSTIQLHP